MNNERWSYSYWTPPAPDPNDPATPTSTPSKAAVPDGSPGSGSPTLPLAPATLIFLGIQGYWFVDQGAFDPSQQPYFTQDPSGPWAGLVIARHPLSAPLGTLVAVPGTFDLALLVPDSDEFTAGHATAFHPSHIVHIEHHPDFLGLTLARAPFLLPGWPIDPSLTSLPAPPTASRAATSTTITRTAPTARNARNRTPAAKVPLVNKGPRRGGLRRGPKPRKTKPF